MAILMAEELISQGNNNKPQGTKSDMLLMLENRDCRVVMRHLKDNIDRLVNSEVLDKVSRLLETYKKMRRRASRVALLKSMQDILALPHEIKRSYRKLLGAIEFAINTITRMLSGENIIPGQMVQLEGRVGTWKIRNVTSGGRFTVYGLRGMYSRSAVKRFVLA